MKKALQFTIIFSVLWLSFAFAQSHQVVTTDQVQTLTNKTISSPCSIDPVCVAGGSASTGYLYASDYGVLCNGVADDTTALQSAINASIAQGKSLQFGGGTCNISSQLTIHGAVGLTYKGTGRYSTTFNWTPNSPGAYAIAIDGTLGVEFKDFGIKIANGAAVEASIAVLDALSGSIITSSNAFRNVALYRGGTGIFNYGFKFRRPTPTGFNDDVHVFDHVLVQAYTIAGFSFLTNETLQHRFYGCDCGGAGVGKYCIDLSDDGAATNPFDTYGSFLWYGGSSNRNSVADFMIQGIADEFIISGVHSEGSARFVDTLTALNFPQNIIIEGSFYVGSSNGIDAMAADRKIIRIKNQGPVTIMGNQFSGGFAHRLPRIESGVAGFESSLIAIGNAFATVSADTEDPFVSVVGATTHVTRINNTYSNATGQISSDSFKTDKVDSGPGTGLSKVLFYADSSNNQSGCGFSFTGVTQCFSAGGAFQLGTRNTSGVFTPIWGFDGSGNWAPLTDHVFAIGSATFRPSFVYSYFGTINSGYSEFEEEASPGVPAANKSRIYNDSTTHAFKVAENGGAYRPLFIPKAIPFLIGAENGAVLTDADDQPSFATNRTGSSCTISEVWCESDTGTPSINLQRDDGSPADILSSNLSCTTSGATSTSFSGSENVWANTNRLDFVMVSAGGAAHRVSVNVTCSP